MNKKQRFWNIAAIYAVGFLQMGGAGMSPVLAEMSKAFPDYGPTAIQFVATIPSIFVVLTNMITGWLCERFPKKYITAAGCALAVFFALAAWAFHGSLLLIYLWAAILGVATSLSCTVSPAIVNEMFEPEERVGIFGVRACFSSIGTMLMTFIGGQLVLGGWNRGFLVYLIMIPGLIMSLVIHPKDTKLAKAAIDLGSDTPFSVKKLILPCFMGFAISMLYSTAMINTAMLVAESSFVAAENAVTYGAILSTVLLAVGGIVGFAIDRVTDKIGLHCTTAGYIMLVVGYLGIYFASAFWMLVLAGIICGGAITMVMPHAQVLGSEAGGSRQELGLSLTVLFANLGTVVSPLLTNLSELVFGTADVRYRFLLAAILGALAAAVAAAAIERRKKSAKAAA